MKLNKLTVYISGSIFCLALTVAAVFFKTTSDTPTLERDAKLPAGMAPPSMQAAPFKLKPASNTVASGAVQGKAAVETESEGLNEDLINKNLAAVRLNKDGELILGSKQKKQLEAAFKRMDYNMGEAQLEKLQGFIKAGLGGEVGEQVATIVRNYYDFKVAEKNILEQVNGADLSSLQSNYEQIVQTRIAYLGPEVNEQLFGAEQRQERYMLEAMLLQNDTSLSQEERQQKQKALPERY